MSDKLAERTKIYHIVHISKLSAILEDNCLFSDAEVRRRDSVGVTIGMAEIKRRRLHELTLSTHPDLFVGECVPFYFCPRSVMLYMFHMRNHPDIEYQGGQEPILHLVVDLQRTVEWADEEGLRWAFTNSNAGSYYFEDYNNLSNLDKLDWNAINAVQWRGFQDKKQAEFLIEKRFNWRLVEGIGTYSFEWVDRVSKILMGCEHRPPVKPKRNWYY